MTWEEGKYVLSTGRKLYANCGIVGIAPLDDELYEGYDGCFEPACDEEAFTPHERTEIADFMISVWEQWKAAK